MRRPTLIAVAVLALAMIYPTEAHAAIDQPIVYLERDPTTGRFLVKYQSPESTTAVSSVEAITAPSLSPDGTRIAFSGVVGNGSLGLYAIYVANVDGSNLVRVTNGSYGELDPSWSPDGSAIVYSVNSTGTYGTACCRIAKTVIGGATTFLTGAIGAMRPDYSPTGSIVTFDTTTGVYTVSANGGFATLLRAGGFDPTFSPDGNWIVFIQKSGASYLLRKVNTSTALTTTIYVSALPLESPVWIGDRVTFIEHAGSGYDGRTSVKIRSVGENGGGVLTEQAFSGKVAEFDFVEKTAHIVGDVTGDSRDDIVIIDSGPREVLRSTSSQFVSENWGSVTPATGWTDHVGGRFDADNRTDTAGYRSSDGTWWVSRSTGTGFTTTLWDDFSTATGWQSRLVGDFDGDGRDDIAQYHPGNGTWWVSRSTGTGFTTTLWDDFSTATGWQPQIAGDFDGDGRDDIANYHPGNGTWWVSRSTGTGFSTGLWADFSTATGWQPQIAGDFDGDGRDDIANYHPGNRTWWVSRSTGVNFSTGLWASP